MDLLQSQALYLSELLFLISCGFSGFGNDLNSQGRNTALRGMPRNISRVTGDKNIFIPCYGPGFFYPIWEINGVVYEITGLPDVYQSELGGLTISVVKKHMNNTSFRCYYPKLENSMILERSSIGFLTVILSNENHILERTCRAESNSALGIHEQDLFIDHQVLLFDNGSKTFAWKVQPGRCYTYHVISNEGCDDSLTNFMRNWTLNSNESNITVPAAETYFRGSTLPLYFNISGRTKEGEICQQVEKIIQVNESTTTRKILITARREFQANISTLIAPLSIALPVLKKNARDCLCPIVIFNENECDDLTNCFCYNDTAIVSFSSSVKVCHNSTLDPGNLQLIIENVKNSANHSRFHFFNLVLCDDNNIRYFRHYIDSYQIEVAQGQTDEPGIHVLNNSEVCFSFQFQSDSYQITLYDKTGEEVYFEFIPNSTNCTYIPQELNVKCTPFKLLFKANTSSGFVISTFPLILQSIASDATNVTECNCIKENDQTVNVAMVSQGKDVVEIFCSKTYISDVKLEIRQKGRHINNQICCTGHNSSHVIDINCEVDCIEIYWISSNTSIDSEVECLLIEYILTPTCDQHESNINIIEISITIATGIVTVTASCTGVVLILFHMRKTWRHKIFMYKVKDKKSQRVTYKSMDL